MSAPRRTLLLAALALTVPLPALALTQDGGTPAGDVPVALSVSASLAGCGLADTQVVCEISFGFDAVAGATSYTASVTSPGGSVTDVGAVGAGGGTAFVPYTGAGYYSVRVNAYGEPEEEGGKRRLIATDVSHEVEPARGERALEATAGPHARSPGAAEATPTEEPGVVPEEPAAEGECAPAPAEPVPPAPAPEPETDAEVTAPEPERDAAEGGETAATAAAEPEVAPAPEPAPATPATPVDDACARG